MTPSPDENSAAIHIETVPSERRREALDLFFADNLPTARKRLTQQWLNADASGEVPLDGLLWALVQGHPVGVAFYSRHPGSLAFVWKPNVDRRRLAFPAAPSVKEIQISLLKEISRHLAAKNIRIGQILIPSGEAEHELFAAGGFPWVTDLHYLLYPLENLPSHANRPSWERLPYDLNDSKRTRLFADVLERTWQDTRDCPELNGLRDGSEALTGHRDGPEYDGRFWSLFSIDGEPIGLCLLNPREDELWEIVYVGVVPEAQGRGYGRAMVQDALYEARKHRQRAVVLAVDARNDVARRIYHEIGFHEIDRLAVYLRLRF